MNHWNITASSSLIISAWVHWTLLRVSDQNRFGTWQSTNLEDIFEREVFETSAIEDPRSIDDGHLDVQNHAERMKQNIEESTEMFLGVSKFLLIWSCSHLLQKRMVQSNTTEMRQESLAEFVHSREGPVGCDFQATLPKNETYRNHILKMILQRGKSFEVSHRSRSRWFYRTIPSWLWWMTVKKESVGWGPVFRAALVLSVPAHEIQVLSSATTITFGWNTHSKFLRTFSPSR